jgi:UDP-N-acetylglucosamine--N-acetylmuramyl-(pentapeptide) pyrophosphoryl-undecaprenol N-acetylglucosamine transferase
MALAEKEAALLVTDATCKTDLIPTALALVKDEKKRALLSENIKKMAVRNADEIIAREILKLAGR